MPQQASCLASRRSRLHLVARQRWRSELAAALEDNSSDENTGPEAMDFAATRHRSASSVSTSIRIVLRYGIWQLTRNGRFYGDYVTRQEAFDAAKGIADAAAAHGECIDVELDGDSPLL
jgi:hypothetical protein